MTNQEALVYTKEKLKDYSESYSIDAQVFVMDILNISKIELLTKNYELTEKDIETLESYIKKRQNHEPVAYITNKVEFMSMNFYVDEHTLIPRPDTEILVEKVLEISKNKSYKNFLEIGVGSGCISVSLGKYSDLCGVGVDIMEECAAIAKINAINNDVESKISFIKSDLFDKISDKYDIIVSNPPYINKEDMESLLPNVKDFEPHTALFGGDDGLDFYRDIVKDSINYLNTNGLLAFEIGYDQSESVEKLMKDRGFKNVETFKDLYKQDRVVIGFL